MRENPSKMGFVKVQLKRSDGKPWNEQRELDVPMSLHQILQVKLAKGNLLVDIGERGQTHRVNPSLAPEEAATQVLDILDIRSSRLCALRRKMQYLLRKTGTCMSCLAIYSCAHHHPASQHLAKTKAAIRDRGIQLALPDELVKAELVKNRRRMGDTRVCYMRAEDDRDDPSKSGCACCKRAIVSCHHARKAADCSSYLALLPRVSRVCTQMPGSRTRSSSRDCARRHCVATL